MSRIETSQREHCVRCGRVTVHEVTTYIDDPVKHETVAYCTECGE